ncbi:MAG TPA: GNAT family N-acetyltransferase [Steroidobacteraceae bacterium]|nr:GNAT family N-acetyltransferase [Steroidobacteraceae bacterium]
MSSHSNRSRATEARRPAPGTVSLRPAVPADLGTLRRWDEDPAVRGALIDADWGWEKELQRHPPWREWLIAEAAGKPIGFIQIIDPENEESRYWGCMDPGQRAIDIWIGEPAARNRGLGAQMMALALQRCFADPAVHTVLVDPLASNAPAHRFYERLGFEFVVERAFGDHRCRVYKLTRKNTPAPN